jgi:hypothetical protein
LVGIDGQTKVLRLRELDATDASRLDIARRYREFVDAFEQVYVRSSPAPSDRERSKQWQEG